MPAPDAESCRDNRREARENAITQPLACHRIRGVHEIAEFLRLHPPFDAMAEDDLETLAAACEIEFVPAGAVLLEQASPPSENVWVIRRGSVALHDGDTLVDLLGEGELFG